MSRPRSLFAGGTDYTGVPLADIVEHLGEWREFLDFDIKVLTNIRKRLAALASQDNYMVRDGLEHADYFLDLLERYKGDISRLESELPNGVYQRHVELAKQLHESCRSEEDLCVHLKRTHHLDALDPDNRIQNTLAEVYRLTRQSVINLKDLSNVVPRLQTYVRAEMATPAPESLSAVTALELKPNFFGIGLNLNYVWDRWGLPKWRRKRQK